MIIITIFIGLFDFEPDSPVSILETILYMMPCNKMLGAIQQISQVQNNIRVCDEYKKGRNIYDNDLMCNDGVLECCGEFVCSRL